MTLPEDGLSSGAEHLMQGETVEIDIVRSGSAWVGTVTGHPNTRRFTAWDDGTCRQAASNIIRPNTTTVVRWHGGER